MAIKLARKIIFICLQDSYVLQKGFSHRTVVMKRDWLNFYSVLFNILEIEKNEVLLLYIQEVFHVYLNKFENDVTHLFLVILGNN